MRNTLIIALFWLVALPTLAQQLTATVNRNVVRVGDRVQLEYKFTSTGSAFAPPRSFPGFRILSGPVQGSYMTYGNGKVYSSISFSYILKAVKEGEFTIGSATIREGKKEYTSKPIKIKVKKAEANPNGGGAQRQLFVKLTTNKKRVLKGEQLIATYRIYTSVDLVSLNVDKQPDFNGFWSQDVETNINANVTTEIINGVRYKVYLLNKTILFPQRSGELTIDPYGLDLVVRVREKARRNSWGSPYWGRFREESHKVNSNSLKIKVDPLPTKGRPDDFSGAVGEFVLASTIDRVEVTANEALNLKVTLQGKGNVKLLESANIDFPSDFEIYESDVKDRISATAAGLSGVRTFEYLVIPRHSGTYQIEPITFSYFSPEKKEYITLKSDPFTINVKKGEGEEGLAASTRNNKREVELVGKDIRYIKTGPATLLESGSLFFRSVPYYLLMAVPALFLGIFIPLRRRYQSREADTSGKRVRKANRMAAKRLATAKKLQSGGEKAFYEEIFRALYGYLTDKLSLPVSDLSKDRIAELLTERQVDETTVQQLMATLDRCEMARFAPMSDVSRETVYNESANIISKMEESLK